MECAYCGETLSLKTIVDLSSTGNVNMNASQNEIHHPNQDASIRYPNKTVKQSDSRTNQRENQSTRSIVAEPTQVQCPNCGGFKTSSRNISIDPETGLLGLFLNLLFFWFILPFQLLKAVFSTPEPWHLGDKIKSSCAICGYEWKWGAGNPVTNITPRPDLIQKGAEQLRKEEEAWDDYWHSRREKQQKKK